MENFDAYEPPWGERYASGAMLALFSPRTRAKTWRTLWLYLAEAEKEAGLDVSQEQLDQMRAALDSTDFHAVRAHEKRLKHDVMAHIAAFAQDAPKAAPIIHLGATSCFVTDNADLVIMRDGLRLLAQSAARVINAWCLFAARHAALPALGFTHLQSAQAVTVGKRAAGWAQSLLFDLHSLEELIETLPFRSIKGAVGSAESFKTLFNGDYDAYKRAERLVADKAGFTHIFALSGQTYDRKWDSKIVSVLAGLAESAHKITNDIRLWQSMGEVEEPFERDQVGSSAMAYKRNPMKSERVAGLAKFLLSLASSPLMVSSTQWMERTLDDSSNRRLVLPQAFLAADSILRVLRVLAEGLVLYPAVIEKNLRRALPFIATEKVMMEAVEAGGDRQKAHEAVRKASMRVTLALKERGEELDLIDELAKDPDLGVDATALRAAIHPSAFIGFCPRMVEDFIQNEATPALAGYDFSVPVDAPSV